MTLSDVQLLTHFLQSGYDQMMTHFQTISLEESLFVPVGGYRSVLGTLKHTAAWSHVYHSYAFEALPRHWKEIDWPYGLQETVEKSESYLTAMIDWFKHAHHRWLNDLGSIADIDLEKQHRVHWGEQKPLHWIVTIIAQHHVYHAGELNQVLSICRGEAWEEGEQVEENNISTVGHRVIPPWKDDIG